MGQYETGTLLVVVGGLGIPSIVRVEADGSWLCVYGIFAGRRLLVDSAKVRHVCQDGDVFEDLDLMVVGGRLVPREPDKEATWEIK